MPLLSVTLISFLDSTFTCATSCRTALSSQSAMWGTAFAPCDIGGDGFALGLCEGAGERDAQLAVLLQRMDVLLFKDDGDAQFLERPCVLEAVHRVAGEAGD